MPAVGGSVASPVPSVYRPLSRERGGPAVGAASPELAQGLVPLASNAQVGLWEGTTFAQLDANSGQIYGSMFVSFPLANGPSTKAIVYTLSGQSTTGDWYILGIGDNLAAITYYSSLGCSTGFEILLLIIDNADSTYSAQCLSSLTFAAGETVELGMNYTSASPNNMGFTVCENSSCVGYFIAQPNPSSPGFSMMTTPRGTYGGFTGAMTWLMDPSTTTCGRYGPPEVDYDFHSGAYVTEYLPWAQQYDFYSSAWCYNYTSGVISAAPGDPMTHYFDASGGSADGPHYEGMQNLSLVSALSGSYWWRFQTDVTPLKVPGLAASRTTADVGQTVTFTPSGSGGTSPYSYPWYLNGTFQSTATAAWTWTPSGGGSYSNYVDLVDADYDESGPSSTVAVSVTSDPTLGVPVATPSSGAIDLGQSVTFTSAAPSGGLSPFAYSWTSLPTGCTNSMVATVTCAPTVAGTYSVVDQVTDGNSFVVASTPSLSYTVDGPLTASLSASPTLIDVGQSLNLTVTAGGGSGSYSYAYSGLPAGCASANVTPLLCTPTSSGNSSVTVIVSDTNLVSATSSAVNLTVDPALSFLGLTAAPASFYLGNGTYLNASASGGTPAYSYVYSGLPSGCTTSSTSSLYCVPTSAGNASVTVVVTDGAGEQVRGTAAFTVLSPIPPLVITSYSVSPSTITQGASVSLTVAATGGVSPYSYAYTGLPAGCSSQNSSSFPCTPAQNGTFPVSVRVSDPQGASVNRTATLVVNPVPAGAPTITSFTVSPSTVTLGSNANVNFTAVVSGGTPAYSYSYAGLPSGCSSSDSRTLTCTPDTAGNYTVTLTVTDSKSKTAQATTTLTVKSSAGTFPPSISSVSATPNPVTVGQPTKITVVVTGGKTPYTYTYGGLPPGCLSISTSTLSCTPTSPGWYNVSIEVQDAAAAKATDVYLLRVTSSGAIAPLSVSLASNATSLRLGMSALLTASVTGGEGAFSFSWALNGTNLSTGPSGSSYTPSFAHGGDYAFTVWVTDHLGHVAKSQVVSIVVGSATVGSQPESSGFPWWILLLVVAAALGLMVFLVVERRRRERRALEEAGLTNAATTAPGTEDGVSPTESSEPVLPAVSLGAAAGFGAGDSGPAMSEGVAYGVGAEVTPGMTPATAAAPLASCPQCGGPLGEGQECSACGVRWAPESPVPDPGPTAVPALMEAGPEAAPPPLLTHCPQCGEPLGADQTCVTCGVGWAPEPPLVTPVPEAIPSGSPESASPPLPPPEPTPFSVDVPLGPPPPPPDPETGASIPEPEVRPFPDDESPRAPPDLAAGVPAATDANPSADGSGAEGAPPPGTASPANVRTCFVCGSLLDGAYCPVCEMRWEAPAPE